jgi:ABC-type methionine transport system permease subunit
LYAHGGCPHAEAAQSLGASWFTILTCVLLDEPLSALDPKIGIPAIFQTLLSPQKTN